MTTSIAVQGTAAYALRPSTRDVDLAIERLMRAARDSTNEDTQVTRDAFVALDASVRSNLLNRVRVLDGQMPPEDLDASVREALAYGLPTGGQRVEDRFVAQVWHYWAAVAVDMLAGKRASVSVTEVRTYVRELRNTYTTESLPTTVLLSSVKEEHLQLYAGARFVTQLELVAAGSGAGEPSNQECAEQMHQGSCGVPGNRELDSRTLGVLGVVGLACVVNGSAGDRLCEPGLLPPGSFLLGQRSERATVVDDENLPGQQFDGASQPFRCLRPRDGHAVACNIPGDLRRAREHPFVDTRIPCGVGHDWFSFHGLRRSLSCVGVVPGPGFRSGHRANPVIRRSPGSLALQL